MNYKLGDKILCVELFCVENLHTKRLPFDGNRIIDEDDVYQVVELSTTNIIYVKELPMYKSLYYSAIIPIPISQVNKYFKCERIERMKKLKNLQKYKE